MDDTPTYDEYQEYQLTDEEFATLSRLAKPLVESVEEVFGARAEIALTNMVGSMLSHMLLEPVKGFYVMQSVNDWLDVASRNHGGSPLQLRFPDEPAEADS